MLSLIKKNEGAALTRKSDRTDSVIRNVGSRTSSTACPADPPPDLLDVLLYPTGMRIDAGIFAVASANFVAVGVEQGNLAACCSCVDSYEDVLRRRVPCNSPLERHHPLGQSRKKLRPEFTLFGRELCQQLLLPGDEILHCGILPYGHCR